MAKRKQWGATSVEYGYTVYDKRMQGTRVVDGFPTVGAVRRRLAVHRIQKRSSRITGMVGRVDGGPWLVVEVLQ